MYKFIAAILFGMFLLSCNSTKKITGVPERWYDLLPDCPCKNPDYNGAQLNDGWAREPRKDEMGRIKKTIIGKKDFTHLHPGATASFRSYPPVITYINGKKRKSGQQCAYDENGYLIKSGAAAGTPDKSSPACGENKNGILRVNIFRVYKHIKRDANPWKKEGWEKYNQYWPPNQGNGCR